MTVLKLLRQSPSELECPPQFWRRVASHTHMLRHNGCGPERAMELLKQWCRKENVYAVGVGSPWEPMSAGAYGYHERVVRDAYFAGQIDPQSVMNRKQIRTLFEKLNSDDDLLFYQDNETPKGRNGHLWYFGFDYQVPAWHDYSQDQKVQYYDRDPHVSMNAISGRPHRRRLYREVVRTQRQAGAVAVWAHPTSWWWGDNLFITNIAAEIAAHLWLDGGLDGMVTVGYDACHRWYLKLWFALLDTGAIVPGFAETDHCFDTENLFKHQNSLANWFDLGPKADADSVVSAANSGCAVASSGTWMHLTIDGVSMGGKVLTDAGRVHRVRLECLPVPGQGGFSRVELIGRGGEILFREDGVNGAGVWEFEMPGSDGHGYLVARAYGQNDDPDSERQQDIVHMGLTNPVYMHPKGFAVSPMNSEVLLKVAVDSRWSGADMDILKDDETVDKRGKLRPGDNIIDMPLGERIRLKAADGNVKVFYPAFESEAVQDMISYLSEGRFLDNYPGLEPGEVPPEAFRIEEMRRTLQSLQIEII